MASVADQYKQLASNIFRGTNVSASIRKSPIELNDNSPTSSLNDDPFHFSSISYPKDVTSDMQNGHYMLFYINVQNKTKYIYQPAEGGAGAKIGEEVQTFVAGNWESSFESYGDTNASYRADLVKKGGTGNVLDSDGVSLKKGRKARTGINSVIPTTTRITDSIAIYLPPNVQDKTTAGYNNQAQVAYLGAISTEYLDSPSTTSAVTYKTQYANNQSISSSHLQVGSTTSFITLMEIAG